MSWERCKLHQGHGTPLEVAKGADTLGSISARENMAILFTLEYVVLLHRIHRSCRALSQLVHLTLCASLTWARIAVRTCPPANDSR